MTILPWFEEQAAQAAPSRVKMFLADSSDARVQRDCFGALATALTKGIAETQHVVPARSAADADVVVQLKECRTATAPRLGGEIGVSAWTGGQGRDVRAGAAIAAELTTIARVVLVVDDRDRPKEFAPDSDEPTLPEAARNVTASLLAWVKTTH